MADLVVVAPGSRVLLTQKLNILLMSDTLFMAKKAFDGKVITVTGAINALNNTIEYVVPNDKTFYFHSAKIVITGHVDPADITDSSNTTVVIKNAVQSELKVDGVVKDTTNIGFASKTRTGASAFTDHVGGTGYGNIGDGIFNCQGLFLVGNGTKKVEIKNSLDDGSAVATIIGWIEDTDTDPSI